MPTNSNCRRGTALAYAMVLLPVLGGVCLIGTDWGRTQMVKMELRAAADSAARYALNGLSNGTALTKANWLGSQLSADGQPLSFAAADVEPGSWDKDALTFTPGGASPSAVRITARRTVPTLFGQWIGATDANVTARAVATISVQGYGLVGLNWIVMQGNSTASYSSGGGANVANQGNIASNGNISLGGSTTVKGNVSIGAGKTVSGGSVQGSTTTLSGALSFPPGDASPYGPSYNDNYLVTGGAYNPTTNGFAAGAGSVITLPGGNYFFSNFAVNGTAQVMFTGPATIYCYGNFAMAGKTEASGTKPGNLKLVMVPNPYTGGAPGSVSIGSASAFYGSIYAPQSAVAISGTGDVYGSVLGLTVSMTGSGSVWYDTALEANGGKIQLVQ
jgi:Flp pilus assembly protein TadG